MRPAIAFMAFPVADAISFQGVTLMVGYLLGPAMVAIFNTYRTLARVSVQATSIFSHTLWPEFSRLFGNGNVASLITLYKRSALVCQIAALSLSAVLYVLSPWLLRVWTHDAIEFIPSLMALLLIYAAVGGLWHLPRVLLLSINKHVRLTRWVLISAIVAVVLSLACGTTLGLNGIGIAMIVSESIVAIACIRSVTQLFRDMSKKK
jgi:O-antigen/teichoic acid export membrane protein